MARVCKCHTNSTAKEKEERRRAMTGSPYHEHRCECSCGCKHDTLGYAYCPSCHFSHAALRNETIGILGIPFKNS